MSLLGIKSRLLGKVIHSPVRIIIPNTSLSRKLNSMVDTPLKSFDLAVQCALYYIRIKRKILPSIRMRDVYQASKALATLKKGITGRVCGDLGDNFAQYLTIVQYVRQTGIRNVDSVEIGTLFWGSCLMKLFAARNLGCSGIITCIDPMSGYIALDYESENDPHSNVPVNAEVFYANIKKFNFSEQDVKLIAERSDSPNVFKELKEKSYATLLIDADHSYDGVKYDWEHYNKYVADGGFVLFDDYNEPAYDVTKFVNEKIESLPRGWKVFGLIGTTFVLQRVPITEG